MTLREGCSVEEYRAYARRQIQSLAEALTQVMFGDLSAVARTPEADEDFGYLCAMINVAINAARNAQDELCRANDTLELRVEERTRALQTEVEERKRAQADLLAVQKQIVEISREAGMAEVATGVLHSVGNVLNSANVSSNLLVEYIQDSEASRLADVVAVLREHEQDLADFVTRHPQGKHLVAHLENLDRLLTSERQMIIREVIALRSSIEHIREIVSRQQNCALVSGVIEETTAVALMEDSLRLEAAALERHGVDVICEYEEDPAIRVDRHRVLQILVNVISNAKAACAESGRKDKRVSVRVTTRGSWARWAITDNGIGIAPENLVRIFSFGFTTRKGGHGFGLHSAALAARELRGSLTAESKGPGYGAKFVLELPLGGLLVTHADAMLRSAL